MQGTGAARPVPSPMRRSAGGRTFCVPGCASANSSSGARTNVSVRSRLAPGSPSGSGGSRGGSGGAPAWDAWVAWRCQGCLLGMAVGYCLDMQ